MITGTSNNGQALLTTADSLVAATKGSSVQQIIIAANVANVPTVSLLPGQSLRSEDKRNTIAFCSHLDGLQLSANNVISNIDLRTSADKRAVFNDCSVPDLGRIELRDVSTIGRVQFIASGKVRAGHFEVAGLDIVSANTLNETERPHEYGVFVLQGAFTLWNRQPKEDVVLTANLVGLSAGRLGAPVLGSGILVSGAGNKGGRLEIQHLETGAVYTNGCIAPGTPDQITGAVFTAFGAHVDTVVNHGPVVTYDANDMALDNWCSVEQWTAERKVMALGASGVGFVNFGEIGELCVNAPVETYGQGARGFNVYTGTIDIAQFDRIVTHADGAVGVQISQPIGKLFVRRGIETFGATGKSLVKGELKDLSAIALSILPQGSARSIIVQGGLKTHGKGIAPLEQHGSVDAFQISKGFTAAETTGS